uniref:Ammonium transporter AmtB-like domain-containing protein n=1 Tax=Daphnia galeata TaxID=27404 RepID=A0A8J2WFL5_9CRUS|nr:unnamed protein product [Daphnia galeata]
MTSIKEIQTRYQQNIPEKMGKIFLRRFGRLEKECRLHVPDRHGHQRDMLPLDGLCVHIRRGGDNGFCGTQYFALIGLPEDKMAHCFFQYTFAATSTSIVKGIMHERCTTTAFICYTCLVSGFIYPVASYWALSDNGWLKVLGFEDFAGSGSIHSLVGSASMAGPRHDRFEKDGKINDIPLHSIPVKWVAKSEIALGLDSGTIKIYQIDENQPRVVRDMKWSDKTQYLVSSSWDNTIRIRFVDHLNVEPIHGTQVNSTCYIYSLAWCKPTNEKTHTEVKNTMRQENHQKTSY